MRLDRYYLVPVLCAITIATRGQDTSGMNDDELAMNGAETGIWDRGIEVTSDVEHNAVRVRIPENAYFMELIDASGSVFHSGTVKGDERFDLIGLPPGTYMIQLRTFDSTLRKELEIK